MWVKNVSRLHDKSRCHIIDDRHTPARTMCGKKIKGPVIELHLLRDEDECITCLKATGQWVYE